MTELRLAPVYEETRDRIVALVRHPATGTSARVAETVVPACPGWRVRDVIAHVTGIYADIVGGNLQGGATDDWTAAQVESRRHLTIDALLAESDDAGPKLATMIDDFPGRYGQQVVADLAVHEQDIRGALGGPGARDSAAVRLCLEFLIGAVVHPGATALGLGPLELRAGHRSWVVGTGDPGDGEPERAIAAAIAAPCPPRPSASLVPTGRVVADSFELFRALTGRRSAAQIRRFEWDVDPEPYLPLFDQWPFRLRSADLPE